MIPHPLFNQFVKCLEPLNMEVREILRNSTFKFEAGALVVPSIGGPTIEFYGKTPFDFQESDFESLNSQSIRKHNYYGLDYQIVWMRFNISPHQTPIQENGTPVYWVEARLAKSRYGQKLFHKPFDPLEQKFVSPDTLPTTINSHGDPIYRMLSNSNSPMLDTFIDALEYQSDSIGGIVWSSNRGVELTSKPKEQWWINLWERHASGYENSAWNAGRKLDDLRRKNIFERESDWQDQVDKLLEDMKGKRKVKRKLKIDPFQEESKRFQFTLVKGI